MLGLAIAPISVTAYLDTRGQEAFELANGTQQRCVSDYSASEFAIAALEGDQDSPKIFQNVIAWQDYRSIGFPDERQPLNADIFLTKLLGPSPISPDKILSRAALVAISKHGLLHIRSLGRGRGGELRLMDLNTGKESALAGGAIAGAGIADDLAAWFSGPNGVIQGVNLQTGIKFEIEPVQATSIDTPYSNLGVSTDLVLSSERQRGVYQFPESSNYDIYAYVPSTGERRQITTDPAPQTDPDVFGNIIVWRDSRLSWRGNIFAFDLAKNLEFPISTNPAGQGSPAIWGRLVVWEDGRNGGNDIFALDLVTKTEFAITDSHKARQPQIWGNTVVWTDRRNDNGDIFGAAVCLPSDVTISDGHFYMQASGQSPMLGTGYSITNDIVASFWDEFQRLGGVDAVGYPASRRFVWDGFTSQVMQKEVFQWRPEAGQVYFVNVFDELSKAGKDDWLLAFRQVPKPFDNSPDTGQPWDKVVERHLAYLDQDPAIKARYLADPDWLNHYGLPQSYGDFGNVFVVRAQRTVFQRWKVDVPWAKAGEVTIANGGDIAKEAGIIPTEATIPESPPIS